MIEIIKPNRTTEVPRSRCTRCMKQMDRASSMQELPPDPGDVSVCLYCGNIMIFGDDLLLRDPSPAEMLELKRLPTWPEIEGFQRKFRNSDFAVPVKIE